jgi:hypothetical protein
MSHDDGRSPAREELSDVVVLDQEPAAGTKHRCASDRTFWLSMSSK